MFEDNGPGIADIELALKDGYSSGKGMGLGLGGARRLCNEFSIESAPGQGTRVTLRVGSSDGSRTEAAWNNHHSNYPGADRPGGRSV